MDNQTLGRASTLPKETEVCKPGTVRQTDMERAAEILNECQNIADAIREKAFKLHLPPNKECGEGGSVKAGDIGPGLIYELEMLSKTLREAIEALGLFV